MKHFYFENYHRPKLYFAFLAKKLKGFKCLPEKPHVLDIGCGQGNFLISISATFPGSTLYGLTISQAEYKSVRDNHKHINLKKGDQINLNSIFKNKKFDLINNFHTLSYLSQRQQLGVTKKILHSLNNDGIITLGTIDSWIKNEPKPKEATQEYIQYCYSPGIFMMLARECRLLAHFKDPKHGYRIQIWKKTNPNFIQLPFIVLYLAFNLVKNRLFN